MSTFIARVKPSCRGGRRAFTLVELMISIMIIAMMAGMLLFAVYAAQESAKTAKTRSLISKLDGIIMNRWESYRTRRVPVSVPAPPDPSNTAAYQAYLRNVALLRLYAFHDIMRMELPDRWTDISVAPGARITFDSTNTTPPFPNTGTTITRPSISQSYYAKYSAGTPTTAFQDAECLYLIVMAAMAEEGDAREMFKADSIKDTDGDGYMEFVDAWNRPIRFIRWPAGFISDLNTLASGQVVSYRAAAACKIRSSRRLTTPRRCRQSIR